MIAADTLQFRRGMVKTVPYKGHPKVLRILNVLKALNITAMDRISTDEQKLKLL